MSERDEVVNKVLTDTKVKMEYPAMGHQEVEFCYGVVFYGDNKGRGGASPVLPMKYNAGERCWRNEEYGLVSFNGGTTLLEKHRPGVRESYFLSPVKHDAEIFLAAYTHAMNLLLPTEEELTTPSALWVAGFYRVPGHIALLDPILVEWNPVVSVYTGSYGNGNAITIRGPGFQQGNNTDGELASILFADPDQQKVAHFLIGARYLRDTFFQAEESNP